MPRTIGLRIKSGFAIAVVASREAGLWRIELRQEITLAPEELPYGRFPYHPLIELQGAEAAATSDRAIAAVRAIAKQQLSAFLRCVGDIDGARIIVGSLIDPAALSNPHIRVHAREGELFRTVVAGELSAAGIANRFLRDKETYSLGAKELSKKEAAFRAEVDRLGRGAVKPWRADEKLATAGAVLAL